MNFLCDPTLSREAGGQAPAPSPSDTVGFTSGKGSKGQKQKLPSIDFFLNIRGEKNRQMITQHFKALRIGMVLIKSVG